MSGCGSEPASPDAAHTSQPADSAATTAAAASALRFADGRVSVSRREVLQLALLEELAARAGFALEVGGVAPRSITLRLDDAPLLDAISAILEGTAFRVEYAVDPGTGAHVLAKLHVGTLTPTPPPTPAVPGGADAAAEQARQARSEKLHGFFAQRRENSEQRVRDANAATEERHARETAAIEQLADADADRRVAALDAIDPAGDASGRVSELAKLDPDPRVRAAAVERLGDADTYQATTVLLDALADPAPEVVIAALAAIEFSGDHSLLPRISALANHPNPAVREAAKEAIEGLR